MRNVLLNRIHPSWLIAALSVGVLAGVTLAAHVPPGLFSAIAWLLTGTALGFVALWKRYVYVIGLAVAGGLLVGLWRGSIEQEELVAYDELYGMSVTLAGVISDDVDNDKRGNTVMRLKNIELHNKRLPGIVWINTTDKVAVKRSDQVKITGKLDRGFGTFAASMYRAKIQAVSRPIPGDMALKARDWFAELVRKAIPDPEVSLGIGYLVGQRRALPEELDEALKIAGLTHIVVASGYNLTILVRLARRLFEKISKYISLVASGGMVVSFMAITGLSPSMSRAGLVAGLSLLAWYYGRKFHPLVLLPLAAAVTVLVNPSYVWGDAGWQLSFAAFAGVMVLAPLMQAFYFGPKKPGVIRQILGETIAATLCTLPILLYIFGYMSNVAIFANVLILPLVPLAMLLVFIAGLGAFVAAGAATIIGFPAYLLLAYMTQTAEFLSGASWATTELTVEIWHVAIMYGGLIVFTLLMWRKTRLNLRDTNLVE